MQKSQSYNSLSMFSNNKLATRFTNYEYKRTNPFKLSKERNLVKCPEKYKLYKLPI